MKKKENTSKILTEIWQKEIAEEAIKTGFIALNNIAFLLARQERYNPALPILWKKYQLDRRQELPEVEDPWSRIKIWLALFDRWANGRVIAVPNNSGLNAIPFLPLHSYDDKNGVWKERKAEFWGQYDAGPQFVSVKELKKYFAEYLSIDPPILLFPKGSKAREAFDEKVKSLRFSFENDSEIKSREQPGKPTKIFSYLQLGFSNTGKAWKVLVRTIQNPPNLYNAGSAHKLKAVFSEVPVSRKNKDENNSEKPKGHCKERNKEYDRKQSYLKEINIKLTTFFGLPPFSWEIPKGYKFYERVKGECKGLYRFKFKCGEQKEDESKLNDLDDDKLLEKIDNLIDQLALAPGNTVALDALSDALRLALDRNLKTKEQVRKILSEIHNWRQRQG